MKYSKYVKDDAKIFCAMAIAHGSSVSSAYSAVNHLKTGTIFLILKKEKAGCLTNNTNTFEQVVV